MRSEMNLAMMWLVADVSLDVRRFVSKLGEESYKLDIRVEFCEF